MGKKHNTDVPGLFDKRLILKPPSHLPSVQVCRKCGTRLRYVPCDTGDSADLLFCPKGCTHVDFSLFRKVERSSKPKDKDVKVVKEALSDHLSQTSALCPKCKGKLLAKFKCGSGKATYVVCKDCGTTL